jgi:hypothetical protein
MSDQVINKVQPQLAQLELMFKGPLVKGSVVSTTADLLTFNTNYNYVNKLVWVSDDKCFYYLSSGDGSNLSHWSKQNMRVSLSRYDDNQVYHKDDTVYSGNRIYVANMEVPVSTPPSTLTSLYWTCISGNDFYYRFTFTNSVQFTIVTDIKAPNIQVITGDMVLDGDNNPVIGTDGYAEFANEKLVHARLERYATGDSGDFKAYKITFIENGIVSSTPRSGYIMVK